MSSFAATAAGSLRARIRMRARLGSVGGLGDGVLLGVSAVAALFGVVVLVLIAYQVVHGASGAISKFGLGFLWHSTWKPNFNQFGAGTLLFGTAVSSAVALLLATPIGIAIGLYLSLLAPRGIAAFLAPLVEMLAAIPSVILGFWGILILAPFVQKHLEPWLHGHLGFLPIFGTPQTTGASLFTGVLVLTIMVVPIIASISRDLFRSVPRDVKDAADALGATRWEMVRGVVLPSTAAGVAAATFLGLGRALGEAIAISQVVGDGSEVRASLFQPGSTLASRIANEFAGATTTLDEASLFYLAVILLVIGLLANFLAQWISRRFQYQAQATGEASR